MSFNSALLTSKDPCWKTPKSFFKRYQTRFNIQLDVCATPGDAVVDRYIAPPDPNWVLPEGTPPPLAFEGLTTPWHQHVLPGTSVWMNPPYGKTISQWLAKASEESYGHGFNTVCLLPSRTDTRWFHTYVDPVLRGHRAGSVEFIRGRIKFEKPGLAKSEPAPFPSMVVVFGPIKENYYVSAK